MHKRLLQKLFALIGRNLNSAADRALKGRGFSPAIQPRKESGFSRGGQSFLSGKRLFHVAILVVCALTMLGANTPHSSFDKIGHQLVCQCGCGQILLECNHVGCPVSGPMIEELKAQMATGLPDAGVLNWFVGKYGPVVLAAPIRGGFDNVAWIVPFAVLILGTVGVALLIRYWRRRHVALQPATPTSAPSQFPDEMRERIRRDTTYQ